MHRLLGASSILIAVLLTACGEPVESPPPVAPPAPPTYHRDIRPLVQETCGSCHAAGGIAPFPLESNEQVFQMRWAIEAAVKARIMPPWMPAKDCTEYLQDRSISDEQIELISRWVDEGGAEGDVADAPGGAGVSQGGLSRVDVELALPEAFSPTKSPDEYRCFVLDWPETAVRYVSGFRGNPGRPSIVHHVIAFLAKPGEVAFYQSLDDADPAPGYECFGGPGQTGDRVAWLGSWVPGSSGMDYPEGTGIQVEPGSKVVLQPWADPSWAQGGSLHIPAGQQDVRARFSFDMAPVLSRITHGVFRDNEPVTVHGAALHMHTLGTWGRMEIERKGQLPIRSAQGAQAGRPHGGRVPLGQQPARREGRELGGGHERRDVSGDLLYDSIRMIFSLNF